MTPVCKKCHHLMFETPHECPTEEYLTIVRKLITAAANAGVTEETEEEVIKRYEKEVIQKQEA